MARLYDIEGCAALTSLARTDCTMPSRPKVERTTSTSAQTSLSLDEPPDSMHADHLELAVLAHLDALAELHALEAAADGAADHALVGAWLGLATFDDLGFGSEVVDIVGHAADGDVRDALAADLLRGDHDHHFADAVGRAVLAPLDFLGRPG